jgi:hypothetical protein
VTSNEKVLELSSKTRNMKEMSRNGEIQSDRIPIRKNRKETKGTATMSEVKKTSSETGREKNHWATINHIGLEWIVRGLRSQRMDRMGREHNTGEDQPGHRETDRQTPRGTRKGGLRPKIKMGGANGDHF